MNGGEVSRQYCIRPPGVGGTNQLLEHCGAAVGDVLTVDVVGRPSLTHIDLQARCESGSEQNNRRLIYIHGCVSVMRDYADSVLLDLYSGIMSSSSGGGGGGARRLMGAINQRRAATVFFFFVRLFHAAASGKHNTGVGVISFLIRSAAAF